MATHSPQSRVVASRVNEIVGRLRERGHRLTPQRYAFVRALVEGGEHPTAEQLFHRVSDAYPMMSRATVYKTLDTLNAAGEVLELEFREAESLRREHSQRPHPALTLREVSRLLQIRLCPGNPIFHFAQIVPVLFALRYFIWQPHESDNGINDLFIG